jgi:hypothetical protein
MGPADLTVLWTILRDGGLPALALVVLVATWWQARQRPTVDPVAAELAALRLALADRLARIETRLDAIERE